MELTTARLSLTPLDPERDATALHAAYRDADVMRWWNSPLRSDVADTRGDLAAMLDGDDAHVWALRETEQPVGLVWLLGDVDVPGLTWMLCRQAWGRGLMTAFAMSIRESKRPLARSPDGAYVLYEIAADGPEGGGSLTYRLAGRRKADRIDFLVSADFSPGGTSQPQLVTAEACARQVDALAAALAKHGFRGVATHPERCALPSRDGLVTVAR